MQTYTVTVNGTTYEVAIEDPYATPVVAVVNGQRYVAQVASGVARPEQSAVEMPAPAPVAAPAAVPAPVPQRVAPVVGGGGGTVDAPMPGKVLTVVVRVGDAVGAGDEVLTLEAMKMAMAVRSKVAGTVREVRVSEGQTVKHGEILLVVG